MQIASMRGYSSLPQRQQPIYISSTISGEAENDRSLQDIEEQAWTNSASLFKKGRQSPRPPSVSAWTIVAKAEAQAAPVVTTDQPVSPCTEQIRTLHRSVTAGGNRFSQFFRDTAVRKWHIHRGARSISSSSSVARSYPPASSSASGSRLRRGQPQDQLSHVNTDGQAHMVDVGAKPSLQRVAIATSCVRFSTTRAAQQIADNNNKKGDVLAVARIAGIMAAKKTPDIIPLCHPILISKVEVNLTLGTADASSHVAIEARVECAGATGVEMEALTAASAAALTIYDMCKAVDKAMDITSTTLAYKSKGNSCRYLRESWVRGDVTDFLSARELPLPDADTDRSGNG